MSTTKPGQMGQTRATVLSRESDVREGPGNQPDVFLMTSPGKEKKRSRGPSSSGTTLGTVSLSVKSSMIRIWYLLKRLFVLLATCETQCGPFF